MSIKTENYDFKASDHCKSFHQAIAGIGSNKTKYRIISIDLLDFIINEIS